MPKATKRADSIAAKIRAYLRNNPTATPKKVAEVCNTTAQHVSVIKYGMKKAGEETASLKTRTPRPVPKKWETPHISTSNNSVEKAIEKEVTTDEYKNRMMELAYQAGKGRDRVHPITGKILMQGADPLPITMHDPVNHPAHYKVGGIETIDFIEAKRLNYNMGNAVKYITRADHKGSRKQDLEKAIWYLKREIEHSV
jgi:hypothetical protein